MTVLKRNFMSSDIRTKVSVVRGHLEMNGHFDGTGVPHFSLLGGVLIHL